MKCNKAQFIKQKVRFTPEIKGKPQSSYILPNYGLSGSIRNISIRICSLFECWRSKH